MSLLTYVLTLIYTAIFRPFMRTSASGKGKLFVLTLSLKTAKLGYSKYIFLKNFLGNLSATKIIKKLADRSLGEKMEAER